MRLPSLIVPVALCILAAGCQGSGWTRDDASEARIASAQPDVNAEELQERILAGRSIRSLRQRDASFTTIALDAAASGQTKLCVEALDQMSDHAERDSAAADSAMLAMQRGALGDAQVIAERIASTRLRDAVFSEIARGRR